MSRDTAGTSRSLGQHATDAYRRTNPIRRGRVPVAAVRRTHSFTSAERVGAGRHHEGAGSDAQTVTALTEPIDAILAMPSSYWPVTAYRTSGARQGN